MYKKVIGGIAIGAMLITSYPIWYNIPRNIKGGEYYKMYKKVIGGIAIGAMLITPMSVNANTKLV